MALRLVLHKKNKPLPTILDNKEKVLKMLGASNPELVDVISGRLMGMYGNNGGSDGKKAKAENDLPSKDPVKAENSEKAGKEEGQVWPG